MILGYVNIYIYIYIYGNYENAVYFKRFLAILSVNPSKHFITYDKGIMCTLVLSLKFEKIVEVYCKST